MLGSPAPAPERAKPGTVDALIEKYKASRFYTEKRPKTKRGYDQNLTIISKCAGDLPVRSITPERVQKLYDAHRERTPAKANAIIRVVRLLFQCGIRFNMVDKNPASEPGLVGTPPTGKLWPVAAIEAFVRAADRMGWPSVGDAVMLNEWLGQREGDLLALPRSVYRNGRSEAH